MTQTSYHKKRFLEHYKNLFVIGKACEATGICRKTVDRWRTGDSEFRESFEAARQDVTESLEKEAIRRAYEGVQKPVFQGGKLVGHVQEYSDTLLIFLLKGAAPDKYRERQEVTGKDGGPILIKEVEVRLSGTTTG